jgi:hypothetical protein
MVSDDAAEVALNSEEPVQLSMKCDFVFSPAKGATCYETLAV